MTNAPSVLVVGGGATGTAVARALTMGDLDVRLVERGGLAGETTGHSHGVLHSGARYAESDPAGARECIGENRVIRAIAPACVTDSGGLFVQVEGDDPDYHDAKLAACRDLDIPVEPVDVEALGEHEPALSTSVERAFAVPDAVVHPGRLAAAFADDAASRGARIDVHTAVVDIEVADDRVTGAVLYGRGRGREHVQVDHVVNATGAWAGRVASMAGVTVAMRPTRGVMVAVEGPDVGAVLNRCRPPGDGDIVVPNDGRLVCGTTSVPVEDPDEFDRPATEAETVIRECAELVPAVRTADRVETYWGVRPLFAPEEADSVEAEPQRGSAIGDARAISRDFRVLDHERRDGLSGLTTVVGGKLTTCRVMGASVGEAVADALGVEPAADSASSPLRAGDDPERLDELLERYDVDAPAG